MSKQKRIEKYTMGSLNEPTYGNDRSRYRTWSKLQTEARLARDRERCVLCGIACCYMLVMPADGQWAIRKSLAVRIGER